MADNENEPFDEVLVPTEPTHPDRHEHAKTPHRLDDDELAQRAQHERDEVRADQEHTE